jgi:hypothetical protein
VVTTHHHLDSALAEACRDVVRPSRRVRLDGNRNDVGVAVVVDELQSIVEEFDLASKNSISTSWGVSAASSVMGSGSIFHVLMYFLPGFLPMAG